MILINRFMLSLYLGAYCFLESPSTGVRINLIRQIFQQWISFLSWACFIMESWQMILRSFTSWQRILIFFLFLWYQWICMLQISYRRLSVSLIIIIFLWLSVLSLKQEFSLTRFAFLCVLCCWLFQFKEILPFRIS